MGLFGAFVIAQLVKNTPEGHEGDPGSFPCVRKIKEKETGYTISD